MLFAVQVSHYQVVHWVAGVAYPLYYCLSLLSISSLIRYLRNGKLLLYSDAMTAYGAEHASSLGRVAASLASYYGSCFSASSYPSYSPPFYSDALTVATGLVVVLFFLTSVYRSHLESLLALGCSIILIAPFVVTEAPLVQHRYLYAAGLGVSLLGAWLFVSLAVLGK